MSMYSTDTSISNQNPLTGGISYYSDAGNIAPAPTSVGNGDAGMIMASGMFINMFSSIAGAIQQSNAIQAQAQYSANQNKFNAQLANIQAQGAMEDGERQAENIERSGSAAVAQERVNAGAAGVEVNGGSSEAVQQSSQTMSALDALTARNNAARQAWGYQVTAANDTAAGNFATIQGNAQSNSTLLTGGLNALNSGMQGYYYGSGGKIKDNTKGLTG